MLANGIRLIVVSVDVAPTVTVMASIRHEPDLESPPGKEGVGDVPTDQLFGYGSKTVTGSRIRKRWTISARRRAAARSSPCGCSSNNSRGAGTAADNELNPAFPADAFKVVRQQTAEFTQGNRQAPNIAPGARSTWDFTRKAIRSCAKPRPKRWERSLSRPRPQLLRGRLPAGPDHSSCDRSDAMADEAKSTIEKWFGNWKASGAKPGNSVAAGTRQQGGSHECPGSQLGAGCGESGGGTWSQPHESGLLSAADGKFRTRRRILRRRGCTGICGRSPGMCITSTISFRRRRQEPRTRWNMAAIPQMFPRRAR